MNPDRPLRFRLFLLLVEHRELRRRRREQREKRASYRTARQQPKCDDVRIAANG